MTDGQTTRAIAIAGDTLFQTFATRYVTKTVQFATTPTMLR